MRRKLWLLLILSLFLVGRESCCASQGQNQEQDQEQNKEQNQEQDIDPAAEKLVTAIAGVFLLGMYLLNSLGYWYFDLHQKEEGWYTCKFYYASGYRTKLFYNRIYLDFYSSLPQFLFSYKYHESFLGFFTMNINVRIYRDFYFVFPIPVLYYLNMLFDFFKTKFSSQEHIDN